ncbi:hypothetical protein D4R51_00910 [bacterium]|nr:MAG: hypothetical protein D4R51_00910 [bacterium]
MRIKRLQLIAADIAGKNHIVTQLQILGQLKIFIGQPAPFAGHDQLIVEFSFKIILELGKSFNNPYQIFSRLKRSQKKNIFIANFIITLDRFPIYGARLEKSIVDAVIDHADFVFS